MKLIYLFINRGMDNENRFEIWNGKLFSYNKIMKFLGEWIGLKYRIKEGGLNIGWNGMF